MIWIIKYVGNTSISLSWATSDSDTITRTPWSIGPKNEIEIEKKKQVQKIIKFCTQSLPYIAIK